MPKLHPRPKAPSVPNAWFTDEPTSETLTPTSQGTGGKTQSIPSLHTNAGCSRLASHQGYFGVTA